MFERVLIANRGEIACRVIRTCKRLGIETVAVYSEADADALHVRMADQAIEIGDPPARDSYLRIDRIIGAAKKAKADAIHPGYGFLSENPAFAEAVAKEGIVFIGPSADVIRSMGDKTQARQLAQAAGVPVIPGTDGEIDDIEAIVEAQRIGYPLMVKAADGGGGMGIRVVEHEAALADALSGARAQAENSFGSRRVYLERRVDGASHVEVQVFGDAYGNAIHLFERDCSVQRRNQKVIEETPCAKIDEKTREALLKSAVELTRAIGYANAGTVEYLVSPSGEFYFLEMNTRLQVEHPITEMVTGLDLVELQLRVAAGEVLPLAQSDISARGAAIEARIYPEDPDTMLPTHGVVERLREPAGDYVRADSALYEGYEVLPHYEPMMAKLVVWGEDRDAAIARMKQAVMDYEIEGVVTNQPLVARVLSHSAFAKARYHNGFLEQLLSEPTLGSGKELVAALAVAMALVQDREDAAQPSRWKLYGRRHSMLARLNGSVS
jgi:acetyl-CoA carboxylase biotin carboxylase subunit